MIKNIIEWLLKVFNIKTETSYKEYKQNEEYAENYKRIDDINFTAIFSNKLANFTVNDSSIVIEGQNKRAKEIEKITQLLWKNIKKATDMAYGLGAIAVVPYVKSDKIYYKIVEQSRILIDEMDGDLITGATIMSERIDKRNLSRTDTFIRWTNYRVENGNLHIRQKYTNEEGKDIPVPQIWKSIPEEKIITNVDRVAFGFIKCPRSNRSTDDKFGVPITYGADATIKEIKETLKQINREFKLKEAFIGADRKMFKDGKLPSDGLYKMFSAEARDGSPFWEIFDPAIRESSYFARLEELYTRLEKEVGTSDGILTKVESKNATATEIKSSRYDTFTIVDDMRANIEKAVNDFLYSCDVLMNVYAISPQGEYEVNYDWDYSLIENSQETFTQLTTGLDKGVIKKSELRNWLKPTETIKESEKAIEEIEEKEPDIKSLLGGDVDAKRANNREVNRETSK